MAQSARHRKFNERPTSSENLCALSRVASTGRDDFVDVLKITRNCVRI